MTDKNYMKRRFKCRCYQKDNTVKIYEGSEIIFDVSYRDFDDAFYLGRKLQSVIMELNELHEDLKHELTVSKALRDVVRELEKENEELKEDIENLKITIKARETLIDVCEKKFNELGYIITVDDDGYVIE